MVDELVSARASLKLHTDGLPVERSNNKRGVLCRLGAQRTSLMERGVSNPGFAALAVRRRPEGCSRPGASGRMGIKTVSDRLCECIVSSRLHRDSHGMHCTYDFCFLSLGCSRPSHEQRRAVLDVVKALAALDPAGFGLDDACAQLEGSTYVMAEEARRIVSALTRRAGGRMVKISSVPSRTLSAVAIRRGAL